MRSGDETTVSVLRFPEGSATARLGVRDFEIHWISRGFRISDWIPVFHVDFWISGFHSGFLDFRLDFCLQCTRRFLSWRTPRGFRTSAFSTCPMYFPVRLAGSTVAESDHFCHSSLFPFHFHFRSISFPFPFVQVLVRVAASS